MVIAGGIKAMCEHVTATASVRNDGVVVWTYEPTLTLGDGDEIETPPVWGVSVGDRVTLRVVRRNDT